MPLQVPQARDAVAAAMTDARREAEAHLRPVQRLDADYLATRARAEAYRHDWMLSPGLTQPRMYVRAHREEFKTHR